MQVAEKKLPHLVTPLPGPKAKQIVERDHMVVSPSYTRDYTTWSSRRPIPAIIPWSQRLASARLSKMSTATLSRFCCRNCRRGNRALPSQGRRRNPEASFRIDSHVLHGFLL